jgi:hypothetical protein
VRFRLCVGVLPLWWSLAFGGSAQAETRTPARTDASRVQHIVDSQLPRLGMTARVDVIVVAHNQLMVSVEPIDGGARFRLAIEESFLQELSDDELNATVAHELGHVWIFTHHPFLQTEAGANDVAMRLVAKDVLERVYDLVYQRLGTKGTVARFVGD